MHQAFAHLTGIAGLALFLANFVPDALNASVAAFLPQHAAAAGSPTPVNRALKADRSASSRPTPRPAAVSSVEVVGVSETTLILRDRLGNVLYRSDPLTNTTLVSKDADIPSITVKEAIRSPTVTRQAPPAPDAREGMDKNKGKRSVPAGCEGIVSSLVDHEIRRVPSLCLALADGGAGRS